MKQIHIFFVFLFLGCFLFSQVAVKKYPQNEFLNPLPISNFLAGNFGELRTNHFHSGIDIKTDQREGVEVYASASGYVSRINVSARGFGNTVYIDHPNGYTTVYAHLQKFNEKIEKYVRYYQYQNQDFEVEIYLKRGEMLVGAGELIAYSGNSGSSAGPHLHFEIRDTKTEEPINPFLFGLAVPDSSKPLINGLYVYPIDGTVNDKTGRQVFKSGEAISASGRIGFGVKTYDKQNGAENLNGTYRISLFVNEQPYFVITANRLNWNDMRGINRLIDYADRMKNNSWVYQLFQTGENPLKIFSSVVNKGVIDVEEGKVYDIRIEAEDFMGNKNIAKVRVNGKKPPEPKPSFHNANLFRNTRDNHFNKEGAEVIIPKGILFDDIVFTFKKVNNKYYIHDWNVPVLDFYTLKIVVPSEIPADKYNKLVFLRDYQVSGIWKKDHTPAEYVRGKAVGLVRDFGVFSVVVDDTNPTINAVNIKENSIFTRNNGIIRFKVSDSQTGIAGFSAFIDEKWVLANFDLKSNSLTIDLNKEEISSGKHQLELKVWDEKENTSTYKANFSKS